MRFVTTFVLVLVSMHHVSASSLAQRDSVAKMIRSAENDSLLLADSLGTRAEKKVELKLNTPLHLHGQMSSTEDIALYRISKRSVVPDYYTSFDEILEQRLPVFSLSSGYHGQPSFWRMMGGGMRDNAVLFDGRPMDDLCFGVAQLNTFPTEFMEQMEVIVGSRAILLGDNASGMLINIQEPLYNVKSPYTRIWYADGANGYIASDGIFAQNIAPNLNLTMGYRRQAADGRYTNQWLDSWNVGGLVRWNMSPHTNVSLSELFTNHGAGTNGGVDTSGTTDMNNELTANVRYPNANQRVFRHDISAHLSSQSAVDSLNTLQATVYYSHAQWNMHRDSLMLFTPDSSLSPKWSSVRLGCTARAEQHLIDPVVLLVGADAEFQASDSTDYVHRVSRLRLAGYGHLRFILNAAAELSGGARIQLLADRPTLAAGASLSMHLWDQWRLLVDASQSARVPSPVEDWSLRAEQHSLAFADIRHSDSTSSIGLSVFARFVNNPIVSSVITTSGSTNPVSVGWSNADSRTSYGALVTARTTLYSFVADCSAQLYSSSLNGQKISDLPLLNAMVRLRYEYRVGRNVLYLGATSRFHTAFAGEAFVPQQWTTYAAPVEQGLATSGIDVIAGASLGDATIKLRFQNILSNSYSTLSTFPIPDRNFSISVAWTFFD